MDKLPEKWALKVTEDNFKCLAHWRVSGLCGQMDYTKHPPTGYIVDIHGRWVQTITNEIEITYSDFKKFVLKESPFETSLSEFPLSELPLNWAVKVNEYNFKHPVIRYLNKRYNSHWDGSQMYYGYRFSSPSGDQCWVKLPKEIIEVSIKDFVRITGYDFVDCQITGNDYDIDIINKSIEFPEIHLTKGDIFIPKISKLPKTKVIKPVIINTITIKIK